MSAEPNSSDVIVFFGLVIAKRADMRRKFTGKERVQFFSRNFYKEESVNRSRVDVKTKTCDIQT
jgi:hypothetical protein